MEASEESKSLSVLDTIEQWLSNHNDLPAVGTVEETKLAELAGISHSELRVWIAFFRKHGKTVHSALAQSTARHLNNAQVRMIKEAKVSNPERYTSPYRGVCLERGKWRAQITFGGRKHFLGTFDNEKDAARAYDRAALNHHGAKAITNFTYDHEGNEGEFQFPSRHPGGGRTRMESKYSPEQLGGTTAYVTTGSAMKPDVGGSGFATAQPQPDISSGWGDPTLTAASEVMLLASGSNHHVTMPGYGGSGGYGGGKVTEGSPTLARTPGSDSQQPGTSLLQAQYVNGLMGVSSGQLPHQPVYGTRQVTRTSSGSGARPYTKSDYEYGASLADDDDDGDDGDEAYIPFNAHTSRQPVVPQGVSPLTPQDPATNSANTKLWQYASDAQPYSASKKREYASQFLLSPAEDGGECPPVDGEAEPYTSRYRGVSAWQGKWRAYICFKGKNHFLGRFETEEQAAAAYDRAALELHGPRAKTNFGDFGSGTGGAKKYNAKRRRGGGCNDLIPVGPLVSPYDDTNPGSSTDSPRAYQPPTTGSDRYPGMVTQALGGGAGMHQAGVFGQTPMMTTAPNLSLLSSVSTAQTMPTPSLPWMARMPVSQPQLMPTFPQMQVAPSTMLQPQMLQAQPPLQQQQQQQQPQAQPQASMQYVLMMTPQGPVAIPMTMMQPSQGSVPGWIAVPQSSLGLLGNNNNNNNNTASNTNNNNTHPVPGPTSTITSVGLPTSYLQPPVLPVTTTTIPIPQPVTTILPVPQPVPTTLPVPQPLTQGNQVIPTPPVSAFQLVQSPPVSVVLAPVPQQGFPVARPVPTTPPPVPQTTQTVTVTVSAPDVVPPTSNTPNTPTQNEPVATDPIAISTNIPNNTPVSNSPVRQVAAEGTTHVSTAPSPLDRKVLSVDSSSLLINTPPPHSVLSQ